MKPSKIFNIKEANLLIPELKSSVDQYRVKYDSYLEIRSELMTLTNSDPEHKPNQFSVDFDKIEEFKYKKSLLNILEKQLHIIVQDLENLNVVIQDPYKGLIDFLTCRDEEHVFLCWSYGETEISNWHRIPDGFAGRHRIKNGDFN